MVDLVSQTVLSPILVANDLQTHGLDSFGLTVPNLSPVWAGSKPVQSDYDSNALTLRLNGLKAPFRAVREYVATPTMFSGTDGKPVNGPIAVRTSADMMAVVPASSARSRPKERT